MKSSRREKDLDGADDLRWTTCLETDEGERDAKQKVLIGAIPGEGIGAEVVDAALSVLEAAAGASGLAVEVRHGGPIGRDAERDFGAALPDSTREFCRDIFRERGAVLCGPGGGRFVYDIRRAFDLFFKISPLQTRNGNIAASRLANQTLEGVDILLVRENCGGIYQGEWSEKGSGTSKRASQSFSYSEEEVERFLVPAAKLARGRRGILTVVWKESGIPSISALWKRALEKVAADIGVASLLVDVDLMAYRLIHEPASFDVIAAPNLFGDVLGDLGAVLLGSRGVSYSGNYSSSGAAVYQTNHGAAYDLAGTGRANPAGQIGSVAMMLRESFGRVPEARAIQAALRRTWADGWATEDVAVEGSRICSTKAFAAQVAERTVSSVISPSADCQE